MDPPSPKPPQSAMDSLKDSFVKNANLNSTMSAFKPQLIQLIQIELFVLFISFSLLFLFLLGCLRKRIQSKPLTFVTHALYTLIPIAIPFVIGLMEVSPFVQDLFPIWALVLVFAYGGVDTITAFSVEDNSKKVVYWLNTMLLWFWCVVFIWLTQKPNSQLTSIYVYPILALFVLTLFNIRETMEAFKAASKTGGLEHVLEKTISYISEGDNLTSSQSQQYCYLIDFGHVSKKTITTQEMWQCPLLSNNEEVRAQRLKDLCLSFAFHKILLMKYACLTLPESFLRSANEFAKVEFLSLECERVFQIIEVELEFVYDFFYTKFYILSMRNPIHKLKRLFGAALCLWFAFVTLHENRRLGTYPLSLNYSGHRVEVGTTRVVMVIFAALECLQIAMGIFSNWIIVKLLCNYVIKPQESSPWAIVRLISTFVNKLLSLKMEEKVITFIWGMKDWISRTKIGSFFVKPWKRKLGQYSLLECFHRNSTGQFLSKYVDIVKIPSGGQKGATSVPLSKEVKRAIVTSIKTNGLVLSPGIASLHRNGMGGLSYACKYPTFTRVILVWHIATSFYEEHSTQVVRDRENDNFRVATELSKYCAYLVTFSCEMIPDDMYVVPKVFKDAIEDAKRTFEGLNHEERYKRMKSKDERDFMGIVRDGFVLFKELTDGVGRDGGRKGWRVLAEFWSELLLFLAPSDDATMHIEHLAQGGEFITHLWALLTHVGVVNRDPYCHTQV